MKTILSITIVLLILVSCSSDSKQKQRLQKRDLLKSQIMALEMKKHYGFEKNQSSNEDISNIEESRYHKISNNLDTTYNQEKQLLLKELKTIESQLE